MQSPSSKLKIASPSEIVRAGAGAGKTRALTFHVMDVAAEFLKREGRLPRIVVTTFTRKATQELRERLMLHALQNHPELIDFVNSRSHLFVSTIHGVLDLYLKRYGGNISIDPSFTILGRIEVTKLARRALRSLLFDNTSYQHFLEIFDFAVLVRLCRKYHELKLRTPDVAPHDIGSLEKCFQELAIELTGSLRTAAGAVRAETDASTEAGKKWLDLAKRLDTIAAHLVTVPWSVSRERATQEFTQFKKPVHSSKNPSVSDETNDLVDEILKEARDFVESHDPSTWQEFADTFSRFGDFADKFSQRFSKLKIDQGALEISDLELLAMDCIRRYPLTAEAFTHEWDYWLIDEYQDTSPFQVKLLKELIGPKPAFIVGDPQQSIYLFRGARSEVFAQREAEVARSGGKQGFLTVNYRSRPELLSFFNDFFEQFNPPFATMASNPAAVAEAGTIVATFFIAEKVKKAKSDATDSGSTTDEPEIEAIVSHIVGLIERGAKAEGICVLARTHKTLSEIAERLIRARLPVHIHAAAGFYDRREIQDALALLRFLINPHDNFNLIELLRSPWFRVPDDLLVSYSSTAIAKTDDRDSLWNKLGSLKPCDDHEPIQRLTSWLTLRHKLGISSVFRAALVDAGIIDSAHRHDLTGQREANLWKLILKLSQEEAKSGFNPLKFVTNSLIELNDIDGSEEGDAIAAVEPNRINLMTVHASKGLAFDHVIVPRLHQRPRVTTYDEFLFDEDLSLWSMRVPMGEENKATASVAEESWLKTLKKQELSEHLRVLYVALTRARLSVFMSWTEPVQANSWASMLNWDLNEGVHEKQNYKYRVLRHLERTATLGPSKIEMAQPRPPFADSSSDRSHGLQSVSVSRILENVHALNTQISNSTRRLAGDAGVSSPDILWRVQVSSYGTAIHRLMEMLKYRSHEQMVHLIEQWFPNEIEKVTRAITWMGEQTSAPVTELIQNGHVEWGFAFTEKEFVIEGQIDLWGTVVRGDKAEIWIVDYKTGSADMREKAFAQMALYAVALRRAGHARADEKIHLAAVYPFSEKVFVQDASSNATALESFEIG